VATSRFLVRARYEASRGPCTEPSSGDIRLHRDLYLAAVYCGRKPPLAYALSISVNAFEREAKENSATVVGRYLSSRHLPGRQLRSPSVRYRSPLPLLCYPFLHRVRWRDVSPRPGQRPILHSAFRALRNRPKNGFPCRCCKRPSYSCGWVVANSSFGPAAGEARPKETFATTMINAGEVEVKCPRHGEGAPDQSSHDAAGGMRQRGRVAMEGGRRTLSPSETPAVCLQQRGYRDSVKRSVRRTACVTV
jgi:hypothetical protein